MAFLSQVEKYSINTVVNGTGVNEEVEVDVDEKTEVIRVNKYEILNDFNTVIISELHPMSFRLFVSSVTQKQVKV